MSHALSELKNEAIKLVQRTKKSHLVFLLLYTIATSSTLD